MYVRRRLSVQMPRPMSEVTRLLDSPAELYQSYIAPWNETPRCVVAHWRAHVKLCLVEIVSS